MDNSDESKSFFKHVFNFDDDSKSEILNILQPEYDTYTSEKNITILADCNHSNCHS